MNVYRQLLDRLNALPPEIRYSKLNEFWDSLEREERFVFLLESLTYFKEIGQLDEFMTEVNPNKRVIRQEKVKS